MISKAIFYILNNDARLSAATKCPLRLPQTVPQPSILWDITNVEPTNIKNSASPLDEVTFNIYVYSKDYNQVVDFAHVIRQLLDRASGVFNTVMIQSIRFQNYSDGYDDGAEMPFRLMEFTARQYFQTVSIFDYSLDYSPLDYNTITI